MLMSSSSLRENNKERRDDTRVAELYQKIGKLEVENDWLKKKSDQFDWEEVRGQSMCCFPPLTFRCNNRTAADDVIAFIQYR